MSKSKTLSIYSLELELLGFPQGCKIQCLHALVPIFSYLLVRDNYSQSLSSELKTSFVCLTYKSRMVID